MAKYSDNYKPIEKKDIGELAGELDSLADLFYGGTYSLVILPTSNIGVCADILTMSHSKSYLQRVEPVVIVLSKNYWQTTPPFVFPDRTDFPYSQFPHVFYEGNNYPAGLCLTRENLRDWYSEHTLRDYVIRLNEWMLDAAQKSLIKLKEHDQFEPQRFLSPKLESTFYRVFPDDSILEKQTQPSCQYFSAQVFDDKETAWGCDSISIPNENAIGLRLYLGTKGIDTEWITEYPNNLKELYEFIQRKGYPFDLQELVGKLDDSKEYVFFMLALLRPTKIIDKDSRINYLCFRAMAVDIKNNHINASVVETLIMDFSSVKTARTLSETPKSICNKKVVILGCGAVGSKIALHLFRSGITKLILIDNDKLEPHNMCRHALLSYMHQSHRNKVDLMKEALEGMYLGVKDNVEVHHKDAIDYLRSTDFLDVGVVIDATASAAVMHGLDEIPFTDETKIIRTCLSQSGNIGITYVSTGSKRLMTDYYADILRQAIDDDDISNWLNNEKKNTLEDVRIGEGCHSVTMKVSDDTISAHAALMSNIIRHIFESKAEDGFLFSIANDVFGGSMGTTWFEAPNYCEFLCANNKKWRVRIERNLLNEIRRQAGHHGKNETGGYLFGTIDHKRQLIYILIHYVPDDVRRDHTQFELSKKGFFEIDRNITTRTANQVYYLGDWHSHPSCPLEMSEKDITTCNEKVLPELSDNFGLCMITKTNQTNFFLLSKIRQQ